MVWAVNPRTWISRRMFLTGAAAALASPVLMPVSRLFGTNQPGAAVRLDRYCQTMGAIASVTVYGPDRDLCRAAVADVFTAMRMVDRLMSSFDPHSDLNLVNRHAGQDPVQVPPELLRVIQQSGDIWRATGGAFDVTIGPLLELYGFFSDSLRGPYPSDRAISRTLESVGFRNVEIDGPSGTVRLSKPGARIDLGGIAVGYALDLTGASLRARGITSALVNHSGDILAIGAPPGITGWEIGIQDPNDSRGTIETMTIRDASVSTSGNYENFRTLDEHVVGHILDPAGGLSASRYLSVTVVAGSSIEADALSTGIFAGGAVLEDGAIGNPTNIAVYAVSGVPGAIEAGYLRQRSGGGR